MARCARVFGAGLLVAAAAVLVPAASFGDEVVKTSGIKFTGAVLKETSSYVRIRVDIGGTDAEFVIKTKDIYTITVNGRKRQLNARRKPRRRTRLSSRRTATRTPRRVSKTAPRKSSGKSKGDTRTRAEVLALIEKRGTTPPAWWNGTPLNFPPTLDLNWSKPPPGWNTRRNISHYMYSVITENPRKWKAGTRFMHHVLSVNKNSSANRMKAIRELGHCYHDYHRDWARAAYWWRKMGDDVQYASAGHQPVPINLAHSYWRLGNKEMAIEQLRTIRRDFTRYGAAIKLWSDMGELKEALRLAESSKGRWGGALTAAGDSCRKHGQYKKAIEFYNKVLPLSGKGIVQKNKERARTAIANIEIYETFDPKRISDGTYNGTSVAYGGDLTVAVTVKGGRITDVKILRHKDKQYYSAMTDTPDEILKHQGFKGIDVTTGATVTADGIINAAVNALRPALK